MDRKAEVLYNFFASVFNGKLSSLTLQGDGQQDEDWGNEVPPTISKDQAHDHLRNLNVIQWGLM